MTEAMKDKKVLFLVNEAYFLLSHRLELLTMLASSGCDVHVAAPADSVWAPRGFDARQIEELGVTFHVVALSRRGQSVAGELRLFFEVIRLLRVVRPEVLHLLTIKPNLYGGIAARLIGVPAVVFGITGLGQVFVSKGILNTLRRFVVLMLFRLSFGHPRSRAILQNVDDRRTLERAGALRAEQSILVPGAGVDLARFRPIPGREDAASPIVLLAARLIWEKGVGDFVDAVRRLRDRGVRARFVLVGDTNPTNPRAVPQETMERWAKDDLVECWGFRSDMEEVYASASIVCFPSTYGEGVPKALLEAAACGKAVIASDIPGCRQVVDDDVNGVLFPAGDVDRLGRAIAQLLGDPALRARLGEAGRRRAELEFGVDKVVEQTMMLYENLLLPTQGTSAAPPDGAYSP